MGGQVQYELKGFWPPQNIKICVTLAILHQFPWFFLSRVQKNIPKFSVYSEYYILWGDRCYIFYKVVESMSHIKNLKRLTSLMGLKEGRHSKIFLFLHFLSLSGYLSPEALVTLNFHFFSAEIGTRFSWLSGSDLHDLKILIFHFQSRVLLRNGN